MNTVASMTTTQTISLNLTPGQMVELCAALHEYEMRLATMAGDPDWQQPLADFAAVAAQVRAACHR